MHIPSSYYQGPHKQTSLPDVMHCHGNKLNMDFPSHPFLIPPFSFSQSLYSYTTVRNCTSSRIRFGSVRFASVRKITFPGSTRFGLHFSDASWLGPVRLGSFPHPVPAGSRIKRFVSVRFGRFGSASFSFLPFQSVWLKSQ